MVPWLSTFYELASPASGFVTPSPVSTLFAYMKVYLLILPEVNSLLLKCAFICIKMRFTYNDMDVEECGAFD